jgi:adenylate cyclase
MVGFTALSQELDAQELAELVDRFETLTHDQVVSLGGRVVKMIGDEVLFVVDDLAAAAEVALALARDWSGTEARSAVRAGLAWGAVLTRYGDVFGPVVNRASRIVALARPGTVLVGPEVHAELEDHPGLAWRSLRPQRLKGIGRLPLWVLRRA